MTDRPEGQPESDDLAPWQALSEPNVKVLKLIPSLVRKGLPLASVARYIATTESRLKKWLERGEQAVEESNTEYEERIYAELYLRVAKAFAEYEAKNLDSLNDPENGHWRRPLSILERRDARNWNRAPADNDNLGGEEFDADAKFL